MTASVPLKRVGVISMVRGSCMIAPSSEALSVCEIKHCYLNGKYIGDLGIPICWMTHVPESWTARHAKNHDRHDLRLGEDDRHDTRRRWTAASVVPTAIDPLFPKLIDDAPFLGARRTWCHLSLCWPFDQEDKKVRADSCPGMEIREP